MCENCIKSLCKQKIRPLNPQFQKTSEFKHLDGVIYALDYAKNPQIKSAIQQFKYRFTQELADYFGDLISEKVEELNMVKNRTIYLVPVPLHKKRLNYRGFNQAEVISNAVKQRRAGTKISPILKRVRHTEQQAKLSKHERHQNLESAFEVGDFSTIDSEGVTFIVDDVCTTGATLENCAKVLKENGVKKVYGLVVARSLIGN